MATNAAANLFSLLDKLRMTPKFNPGGLGVSPFTDRDYCYFVILAGIKVLSGLNQSEGIKTSRLRLAFFLASRPSLLLDVKTAFQTDEFDIQRDDPDVINILNAASLDRTFEKHLRFLCATGHVIEMERRKVKIDMEHGGKKAIGNVGKLVAMGLLSDEITRLQIFKDIPFPTWI